MESSDLTLSSDWDIVNSSSSENSEVEAQKELHNEMPANDGEHVDGKKGQGSCVHDVLNEQEMNHHNESNSSSDVDVIDDVADEATNSSMSIHPMDYSLGSSLDSTPIAPSIVPVPVPGPEPNHEDMWNSFLLTHRLLRNPQFKDYLIIIVITIAVAATMHLHGCPEDKIKQMREEVSALKKENTDLKNRVLSKIEDDKLFLALEEQITALKSENLKLSNSLQLLIMKLEEQTVIFKKENEMREKDPYKIEIDKLKEQVNILRIDNEELQKQLVRMRYGIYSPYFQNPETDDTADNKEEKVNLNDFTKMKLGLKNENSSDILTEEIKELRKKLYSEVDKLKDWKESVNKVIKRLDEKVKIDIKENLENKRASREENPQKGEEERSQKAKKSAEERSEKANNKEKKFYDWTWKDIKKNFRGTLDNLHVSDMLSKYVDQKKVEGVFESVGHYFKKAQEKTKKILDFNKDDVKNDVWEFLGDVRKKWANVKNEFFETHYKNGPMPPDQKDDSKPKSSSFQSFDPEKPSHTENEKMTSKESRNSEDARILESWLSDRYALLQKMMTQSMEENFHPSKDDINELNEFWEKWHPSDKNSWMFDRAAIRSVLREHHKQDDSTNWFLRRKRSPNEEESIIGSESTEFLGEEKE